jgi:hypothetical protein
MVQARTVGQVIAGEAVSGTPEERWADMVNIASVIANRAAMLGVTPQQVIANTNEFNAYNRAMPPGTQDLTAMAEEAMNYVAVNGPVNNATFYATPEAVDNLPSGLLAETATTGHQYFSDPQQRAIGTSLGYRAPNEYAYAANPENVPTPSQPSLMGAVGELGNTWTINGVTPALTPTVEGWSAMAAADPVQTTMGTPAAGLLGSAPINGFADMAAAGPMGLLSAPSISQADISRALSNVTTRNEFDPSFTAGLMGPNNPVVPTSVETTSYTPSGILSAPETNVAASRFSTPETTSRFQTVAVDPSRMPMSIDPATNTQSFMDAPQTAVATGVNSPEHINGVQAQAERQLAALSAMPSGLLSANPALAAPNFTQALNPSVPSLSVPTVDAANAYAATPSLTPAAQAINSVAAPSDMMRELPGFHVNPLDGNIVRDKVVEAPALDSVSVPDQPTIAGPATTEVAPAQEQQQAQQVQQAVTAAAPQAMTMGDKLKAAVNPGTAIGGLLGGVTMGPIGGLLGGLLGNAVNQGSFSGLLGGPSAPGGFIGSGPAASYGIYGGGYAPGSYAMATDGSRVTSGGGGWTTRTTADGVTSSTSPWGGGAGWFGGDPTDAESYT